MARPRRAASPDTEAFSGSLRAAPRRCFIISARTTAITPIIADGAGNLYGTTCSGGADDEGTVFELAPGGRETILYSFGGKSGDGNCPAAGLTRDKAGNLYGTTETGGTTGCRRYAGCGTVFRLAPDGSETVVYAFRGRSHGDGAYPEAGLIRDRAGRFYGTTDQGGTGKCNFRYGCGTVFELTPGGREKPLHVFTDASDGADPLAGLIEDGAGNLYGTTPEGGAYEDGTVFSLAPDGSETVLHAFPGGRDGANPAAGLIGDANGNLYGTTKDGGEHFDGTVFRLAPDGSETVLHTFAGGTNGAYPVAGLIEDGRGNLYGTTKGGGGTSCQEGCGTVFVITAKGE